MDRTTVAYDYNVEEMFEAMGLCPHGFQMGECESDLHCPGGEDAYPIHDEES